MRYACPRCGDWWGMPAPQNPSAAITRLCRDCERSQADLEDARADARIEALWEGP